MSKVFSNFLKNKFDYNLPCSLKIQNPTLQSTPLLVEYVTQSYLTTQPK